jgi:hypothetical protein
MANTPNNQTSKDEIKDRTEIKPTSSVTEATDRFNGGSKSTGTGTGAAAARSFYDQAKETAGQAYEAVSEKAVTKIDEQKTTLSGGISTVADSIRQVGDNLGSAEADNGLAGSAAKYTQSAAQRLEELAGYFETKSVRDMARDLEGFARRNPAVFLGAAFGLGFLAARFLKSGSSRQFEKSAGSTFETNKSDRPLGRPALSDSGKFGRTTPTSTESF